MTEQEFADKFESLTTSQKKVVMRECKIIKNCATETFFVETGCQADDHESRQVLIGFAMMGLRLISVDQFYGVE